MPKTPSKYYRSEKILKDIIGSFRGPSILLVLLMLLSVLFETFSVGSVFPLLKMMLGEAPSGGGRFGWLNSLVQGVAPDKQIIYLGAGILVLFALRMAVQLSKEYYSARFTNMLREYWSTRIFKNLVYGDLLSVKEIKQGHLINSMINEPIYASKGVSDFIDCSIAILMLVSITTFLLWIDWKTTITVVVVLFGIVGGVWTLSSRFSENVGKNRVLMNQDINQIISESASGIRQIKVFSVEVKVLSVLRERLSTLMRTLNLFSVANAAPKEVGEFVVMCLIIGGVLFGKLVLKKDIATLLPQIAVFGVSFMKLFSAASLLLAKRMGVATYWPSIEAVQAYSEREIVEPAGKTFPKKELTRKISVSDLVFNFTEDARVLKNITFEITRGEMLGLAGRSGSGKSTLCDLLAKLLVPTSGKISIDGVDLKELDTGSWRRKVGYVSQDTFLFNASVLHNILIGCDHQDREVAINAAERAGARSFIEKLPQGFDTVVGTGGIALSGGQKQRIGLAQALARNPDLLILDETTSGLDFESEAEILNLLKRESVHRCTLIITHRLNTLKLVDRVMFLEQGRIAEVGTFTELSQASRGFKNLLDKEVAKQEHI